METDKKPSTNFEASLVAKNGFYLIDIHVNSLDAYKSFNIKPDDVFIASFPKSGRVFNLKRLFETFSKAICCFQAPHGYKR